MATYVLVHGGRPSTDTWNQITGREDYPPGGNLGGEYWKYVVAGLEEQGHLALAPTLGDENISGLSDHIDQVVSLVVGQGDGKVILVGHSYGGMVITGVAAKISERIAELVYLDADYPDPGQSLFDILKSAGFDPEQVVGGSPRAYTEKLHYEPDALSALDKVYIQCTKSEFSAATRCALNKARAEKGGWRFWELPCGHLAPVEMPEELTKMLLELKL